MSQSLFTRIAPVLALLAASLTSVPARAQLPLVGVPEVENGVAEPFAGSWSAIRPGATETLLTCHVPTVIAASGDGALTYNDIAGRGIPFTVEAYEGGTRWQGSETQLAVWTGPDSFLLYPILAGGQTDADRVVLYERCVTFPREDHPGATPGDAAPFAGRWQEALPAERGFEPSVTVSCERATTIALTGDGAITMAASGGQPLEPLPVAAREGRTVLLVEGQLPYTIVWVSPDRFHLHGPAFFGGGPDWNLPVIFTRCPG